MDFGWTLGGLNWVLQWRAVEGNGSEWVGDVPPHSLATVPAMGLAVVARRAWASEPVEGVGGAQ